MPHSRTEVMPFGQLQKRDRIRILHLIAEPRPPKRFVTLADGLFQMEDRAWYEWYWARGIDPLKRRPSLSSARRRAVIARDGYVCGICGDPVPEDDIHIDHIRPRIKGGTNAISNLQVSHSACNLRKGASV